MSRYKSDGLDLPRQTCPDIDKAIELMETLRAANAALREEAERQYELAEEARKERDDFQEERDILQSRLDEAIAELQAMDRRESAA